jgi:tetratricopeptide (TPR) repeat protein
MMPKKIPFLLLGAIVASVFCSLVCYGADDPSTGIPDEVYYNKKGMSHFKKGFYEFTPQKRKKEAEQQYGLAIQQFQKALALNPDYAEAHRNLGRVYSVRGQFTKAATHYKKLTALDPHDIDSYVLTALAYAEADQYDDARAELETAKSMTTDKQVIKKLDHYIEKLEQARR